MALAVRGFGGSFGAGEETAWGTEVARTVWLRAMEMSVERKRIHEVVEDLGSHGSLSTVHMSQYLSREDVDGRLVWPAAYDDGTQMMLAHMFGGVADAGAGPTWTHTYKLASPPMVAKPGLSLSLIKGTHASLSTGQEVYGAKFDSWEHSCEAGKMLMLSCDVIARTGSSIQAAETPTYGTPTYVLHNQMSTALTANAVAEQINKFSLKVSRNMTRIQELGTPFTIEPFENRMMVELDVELLWASSTPHTNYYAGNQFDYTWGFSSGSLAWAYTLFNGLITECSTPSTSAEGVRQTLKIKGFGDGGAGDQGLQLVVTNENALYTAN